MISPLFKYFGGKHRWAKRYPAPLHDTIIEPFAGSAGYASRYCERNVVLYDIDNRVTDLWDWLIHVDPQDVMNIPTEINSVDDVDDPMTKLFISCWVNTSPFMKTPSKWMREAREQGLLDNRAVFWGTAAKTRVAQDIQQIRHWQVHNVSWQHILIPDKPTTFFVDPPYQKHGVHYRHGASAIDFNALGDWCRMLGSLGHQFIVCENQGATWLPFVPVAGDKAFSGARGSAAGRDHQRSVEVFWTNVVDK